MGDAPREKTEEGAVSFDVVPGAIPRSSRRWIGGAFCESVAAHAARLRACFFSAGGRLAGLAIREKERGRESESERTSHAPLCAP